MIINCIVQARMGSKRFPGKVMAEVAGKPLIGHLLDRIMGAEVDNIIVAIPYEDEVTPLGSYIEDIPWAHLVVGPEEDVAARFECALLEFPCDAFIRVCADSPLLDASCINLVADYLAAGASLQLASEGIPGLQAEGIRTDLFTAFLDEMTDEEREHVTLFFKRRFSCAVDTPEDLERIRPLLEGRIGVSEWLNQVLPV